MARKTGIAAFVGMSMILKIIPVIYAVLTAYTVKKMEFPIHLDKGKVWMNNICIIQSLSL